MKYQKEISKRFIKVWEDFYIDYMTMFTILKPAREAYKKDQAKKIEKQIKSMEFSKNIDSNTLLTKTDDVLNTHDLVKIHNKFQEQFILEIKKVDYFYQENINQVIKPKLKEIKEQIKHAHKINEFKMNNETFEVAIKETYKDIFMTQDFIDTNMEIKAKLIQKYNKYFHITKSNESNKDIKKKNSYIIMEEENEDESIGANPKKNGEVRTDDVESSINNVIEYQTQINKSKATLDDLLKDVIELFRDNFTYKYKEKTEKVLKKYVQKNHLTESQSFYLGFFVGLLIFELIIVCIIAYYYDIDMDRDVEFKSVFPMFRGFFIVCLYWWMNGINVYVWMKAEISYRVIFQYDNKYSTPIEIFKRASIFTFILLCCLLVYMIKRIWVGSFFGIFDPVPINMLPLICWGSLIIYMFCPFDIWNYEGRAFLGNLAKESFTSFLLKTGFRHVFFMGQMCTFIAPMRDLEYTICYYAYYDAPLWAKKEYCNKTRGVYLFIAFVPNFLRILQNMKEIHDTGKFFPKILSIGQYSLAIFVAILSFLWPQYPSLHIVWLIFTFLSSCASFSWDIIIDFGFLEKGNNFPLRNKLYYKPKIIYYLIALYDFILRFFWLLTISPEVLGSLVRPETLSIILNSFEITRRGCWNFLKVENKHIDISKEFKVSNDVELPFVKEKGKYVNNETNLVNIMKYDRQQKIQVEIEKILQEKENNKITYMSRNLNDWKEAKGKVNHDLIEYLEAYKRDTFENVSTQKTGIRYLSRKI